MCRRTRHRLEIQHVHRSRIGIRRLRGRSPETEAPHRCVFAAAHRAHVLGDQSRRLLGASGDSDCDAVGDQAFDGSDCLCVERFMVRGGSRVPRSARWDRVDSRCRCDAPWGRRAHPCSLLAEGYATGRPWTSFRSPRDWTVAIVSYRAALALGSDLARYEQRDLWFPCRRSGVGSGRGCLGAALVSFGPRPSSGSCRLSRRLSVPHATSRDPSVPRPRAGSPSPSALRFASPAAACDRTLASPFPPVSRSTPRRESRRRYLPSRLG